MGWVLALDSQQRHVQPPRLLVRWLPPRLVLQRPPREHWPVAANSMSRGARRMCLPGKEVGQKQFESQGEFRFEQIDRGEHNTTNVIPRLIWINLASSGIDPPNTFWKERERRESKEAIEYDATAALIANSLTIQYLTLPLMRSTASPSLNTPAEERVSQNERNGSPWQIHLINYFSRGSRLRILVQRLWSLESWFSRCPSQLWFWCPRPRKCVPRCWWGHLQEGITHKKADGAFQ